MSVPNAAQKITRTVLSWEHVESHPHRFGGTEFRIGKRELGHIHGDVLLDIPFPKRTRDELVAAGAAEPHHVLPDSGWSAFIFVNKKTWIEPLNCSGNLTNWR